MDSSSTWGAKKRKKNYHESGLREIADFCSKTFPAKWYVHILLPHLTRPPLKPPTLGGEKRNEASHLLQPKTVIKPSSQPSPILFVTVFRRMHFLLFFFFFLALLRSRSGFFLGVFLEVESGVESVWRFLQFTAGEGEMWGLEKRAFGRKVQQQAHTTKKKKQ